YRKALDAKTEPPQRGRVREYVIHFVRRQRAVTTRIEQLVHAFGDEQHRDLLFEYRPNEQRIQHFAGECATFRRMRHDEKNPASRHAANVMNRSASIAASII